MAILPGYDQSYPPIVSKRAPTAKDHAEIGTLWIDKVLNDVYVITSVGAAGSVWINAGGGSGTFSSLNISGASVLGGAITASTFGRGLVFSSVAGVLSAANGTNGQVVLGKTAGDPAWGTITSSDGSLVVALGANTLDLTVSGATVSSFPTDAGTANPVLGATTIAGGTNLNTSAAGGTVTINLDNSPSVSGSLTAGIDLNMTSGTCTITSNTNAANAIYLHANAGVAETVHLYSQQGTGVDSVNVNSLLGGITVAGGKATATAVNLTATNAAGGITLTAGTAGVTNTITNGAYAINTGTGAINIGTDAVAKIVTIGNATGGSAVIINSGTGDIALSSQDKITLDSTNNMDLNTSAGAINIATNAVAVTTTIGNATGISSVVLNVGTGNLDLGITATDHSTRVGSTTGVSALTLQAGTGAFTCTAGGAFDVNAVGAVTIDSTGAAISIGNGADAFGINLGTGAAQRNIIIGNATGTTSVVVNGGTGNMHFGANATDHTTVVGSVTGTSATSVKGGTGALDVTGLGVMNIDAAGALSINSSAGIINIGDDAVAQNIYVGTGAAARTINIGNNTGATSVVVTGGTGVMQFGANAIAHATTIGSSTGAASTTIQGGTGGIAINAAGIVTVAPATDTQAANAVTINANVGVGTFTGLTTAVSAVETLTVTNSTVTAGKAILCTLQVIGAEDCVPTIHKIRSGAGSFTVKYKNDGTDALASNLVLAFWVLN